MTIRRLDFLINKKNGIRELFFPHKLVRVNQCMLRMILVSLKKYGIIGSTLSPPPNFLPLSLICLVGKHSINISVKRNRIYTGWCRRSKLVKSRSKWQQQGVSASRITRFFNTKQHNFGLYLARFENTKTWRLKNFEIWIKALNSRVQYFLLPTPFTLDFIYYLKHLKFLMKSQLFCRQSRSNNF